MSEWISVEDRLPTKEEVIKHGTFLVVRKFKYGFDYSDHRGELDANFHPYEDGHYGEWTCNDENGYPYKVPVTHWMPLPEPPNE